MSKVVIFPTDTVYGIGCPIFDIEGIHKIYDIKHRSLEKPLACLCANLEQIESIAEVNEQIKKLIVTFLPGPLTLILKSKQEVYTKIGYRTIGVRIPNCKLAQHLLNENGPMLTTSVNESGEVPLNTYDEIKLKYQDMVDEIYDSTESSSNLSSTVVDFTQEEIRLLREGSITLKQIKDRLDV